MKARKYFLISFIVILIDQVVKVIIKKNMSLGEEIPVLGDVFKIHFIENKGAAFGMTIDNLLSPLGVDMTPETSKLILSIFSLIALVFIGVFLYRLSSHKSPLPFFVALIFGGAMGNIIDRTFYGMIFENINNYEGGFLHGRVVDMFYFDIWKGYLPDWLPFWGGEYYSFWPIFNIADSAISIGIVVILIFQGRFFKMNDDVEASQMASTDAAQTINPEVQDMLASSSGISSVAGTPPPSPDTSDAGASGIAEGGDSPSDPSPPRIPL
ncbi:MAG: lipoprotein signal peptidase [Bacteroidota bacterium]